MPRSLRDAFRREAEFLRKAWGSLLTWLRSSRPQEPPPSRGRRKAPVTERPVRYRAPMVAARSRPSRVRSVREKIGHWWRVGLALFPSRQATLAIFASLGIHVIVLALVLSILSRREPEAAGPPSVHTVMIRLKSPPPPSKSPPEPVEEKPSLPPIEEKPTPPEVARAPEKAPAPDPADSLPASSGKPSPLEDREPSPRAKSTTRPLVGVGMKPPPLGLGGRTGTSGEYSSRFLGKAEALRRYGGGAETENAVERGLRWLAAHQDSSGAWDPMGFSRHCRHHTACRGKGFQEFEVGVTSLATLAFLGAGHVPRNEGPYRRHVDKALDYLRASQDGAGAFGVQAGNYMYNHALATFALSEAFALTRRPEYRECLAAALRYSESAQQSMGGWDYTSEMTGRNDLSITGWQVMALRSAENAGLPLRRSMVRRARDFIDWAFTSDGYGVYTNNGSEAGRRGINMVAVALLSHLYLGGLPDTRACKLAAERILADPPRWERTFRWDDTYHSYYYWYSGTLCLFHLGGKRWEAWNHFLQQALLPLQSRKVHEEGSWPPEASWIGQSGGRVYATAINVLTLEIYYRYQPLFGTRR